MVLGVRVAVTTGKRGSSEREVKFSFWIRLGFGHTDVLICENSPTSTLNTCVLLCVYFTLKEKSL